MHKKLLIFGIFLATAGLSQADNIAVGTAGNSTLSQPTQPSPSVGAIISFSGLADGGSVPSVSTGDARISSPDGVEVIPYSTMFNTPNEIYDTSSNGTANLSLLLSSGTSKIGVGVADSDGVSITLQALSANGTAFGSIFTENLSSSADVNGNSYFVISDSTSDLYGFQIKQSAGSVKYSGLAIGDVETAPTPEPATFALLGASLAVLSGLQIYRKTPGRKA